MKKNQKYLLKGLTEIANCNMIIEDAESALEDLTVTEINEVLEVFGKTITEFNEGNLMNDAFNFKETTSSFLVKLSSKLKNID